jgi:zinc/manganese transport system permease protein
MISFLLEPFSYAFLQRGLLVAALLGLSGGLLGCILVLRRLSLMGDALSHSLLPGIGVAYLLFGPSLPALLLGALLAGLLTALGGGLVSRLTRIKEDAAFGSLFLVLFAAGVALVSRLPARVDLLHFLFGNILGVGPSDVALAGGAAALTVAVFALFRRSIVLETFDPVFHRATGGRGWLTHLGILALCVINLVAALQAMGVVLALGLFLLPAVTAYLWCDRLPAMLAFSAITAVLGSIVGILVSYHAGLPSGAAIVLALGAFFLLSALGSPRYGIVARVVSSRREGKAIRHTAE